MNTISTHKIIEVVAAVLIKPDHTVFIAKRSSKSTSAGKWEFPGGKVEPGETQSQALKRELIEELSLASVPLTFWREFTHAYDTFDVRLHFFTGKLPQDTVLVSHVHDEIAWVSPQDFGRYDFLAADIEVTKAILDLYPKLGE